MSELQPTPPQPVLGRRLRVEPWGVDYVGSLQDLGRMVQPQPEESVDELEPTALGVELPLADWRPLAARRPLHPSHLLFIDGSRRIEARVLLEEPDSMAFGAVGSCAVGVVISQAGRADFLQEPVIERWCLLSAGRDGAYGLRLVAHDGSQLLQYRVATTAEADADAPARLLHSKMQQAERNLAARLLGALGDGLLLCDGPRPLLGDDRRVLGYLKTVQAQRLPAAALAVVRGLQQGQRSPLYLVGAGQAARFEWYLRLRDPGIYAHTLAGSVRLQAYAGPDPAAQVEWARQVADWSCGTLPRYATRAHQDPRAPQQLLPVRALEQMLQRRLGSAPLIRRRLVATVARQEDAVGVQERSPGP